MQIMKTKENDVFCICVHCDTKTTHIKGKPCKASNCPQCGKKMMREGSAHHQLFLKKKGEIQ